MQSGFEPGESGRSMDSDDRLPSPWSPILPGEAPFQLEASRDGVRLRLDQAILGRQVQVRNLQMAIERPPGNLDLSAGPRSLRSFLATLEGLEVWAGLQHCRGSGSGEVQVETLQPCEDGQRIWVGGRVRGVPFSLRVRVLPTTMPGADLDLRFEDPRVFGWSGVPWRQLGFLAVEDLRVPWVRMVREGRQIRVAVLSPLLQSLLVERGWKVPDRRGVRLLETRREGASTWVARFGRADGEPSVSDASQGDPEWLEPLDEDALRDHFRGNLPVNEDLLVQGLDHPRLWPEVLRRCRDFGEERPDRVGASLVALLLAGRRPDLVTPEDRFRWIRRLVAGLAENAEGLRDLRLASGFIGEAALGLPPGIAWTLMEEMLSLGIAEPDLMRLASICLDRLGRRTEAESLRHRMIALARTEEVGDLVHATLAALDAEDLSSVADDWLERLVDQPEKSGVTDPTTTRALRKIRALRLAVHSPGRALGLFRALLEEDPFDPEVQDLVRITVREDSEANEVATHLVAMAEGLPRRREVLRYAASLLENRPGFRGKAVRWYEESLIGDPDPDPVLDALDRLYGLLDRRQERKALLDRRIAADPESSRAIVWRMERVREALAEGDDPTAARLLREVLDRDPTHREALLLAREVHRRSGDQAAMREVQEVLRDLGDEGPSSADSPSDQAAWWLRRLEQGWNPEEALEALVQLAAMAVEQPPEARHLVELLEQAHPVIGRLCGSTVAADLQALATWLRESTPEGPAEDGHIVR